ncbi:MAG: replicative DNA helicase [Terriglobales bacterium]|jgi:replicative DNA helicase
MPANIEAERSILGAILLDNHAYNDAAEHLRPDDFSLDSHRRIYARMMDLAESSRPIDIITLVEELDQNKDLQAIGDVGYVSSLLDGVPDRPSIEHYVHIVRDKAMLRGLIGVANNAIAKASEQADPADEILNDAEAAVFALSEKRIGKGFQRISETIRDSGGIDAFMQRGQRITGLATHFDDLDEMTSGFQKADLVILAARPSMGKTSFAMNIAENAAIDDKKVVGMFSLEMSAEALLHRLLSSRAIIDAHKLRTGSLWKEDKEKLLRAAAELAEAPLFIDDTPGISLSEMRAKARRLKQAQHGQLDLIVVDYLQLMSGGSKRFENRTQEVSAISRGLKAIAKELEVPVVALSQLSRAPESRGGDHRPQLSDLRESGSIEQDADVVMFIFREEIYKQDDPELKGRAEIIIAKQRNGPIGKFHLAFMHGSTRFGNLASGNNEPGE